MMKCNDAAKKQCHLKIQKCNSEYCMAWQEIDKVQKIGYCSLLTIIEPKKEGVKDGLDSN